MRINQINSHQILCTMPIAELASIGIDHEVFLRDDGQAIAFFSALMDAAFEAINAPDDMVADNFMLSFDEITKDMSVLIQTGRMGVLNGVDENEIAMDNEELCYADWEEDHENEDNYEDNYDESYLGDSFDEDYEKYKEVLSALLRRSGMEKTSIAIRLNNLDEAIRVGRMIGDLPRESSLLKDNHGTYILLIPLQDLDEEKISRLICSVSDFVKVEHVSDLFVAKANEHYEKIIEKDAVEKLKKIP